MGRVRLERVNIHRTRGPASAATGYGNLLHVKCVSGGKSQFKVRGLDVAAGIAIMPSTVEYSKFGWIGRSRSDSASLGLPLGIVDS